MSRSIERRNAQRNKQARTHDWDLHPEYHARMVEYGQQHVVDDAPIPWPGHGRPATTVERYILDEGI